MYKANSKTSRIIMQYFLIIIFTLIAPYSCTPTTPTPSIPASSTVASILIRRRLPADTPRSRYTLLNSRLIRRRPKKKNLDPSQLHDILGRHFDVRWMSAEDPGKEPEYVVSGEGWSRTELGKQVQRLNLSKELGAPKDVVRTLENWLLKKGSCPVKYAWEDIGPLFWPRFVRRGECGTSAAASTCSWPPGMHCVPARTSTLHVLRWQCKAARTPRPNRKGSSVKTESVPKCSWIVVPYPITTDCMCTC